MTLDGLKDVVADRERRLDLLTQAMKELQTTDSPYPHGRKKDGDAHRARMADTHITNAMRGLEPGSPVWDLGFELQQVVKRIASGWAARAES